jgi:hypothetical protein
MTETKLSWQLGILSILITMFRTQYCNIGLRIPLIAYQGDEEKYMGA